VTGNNEKVFLYPSTKDNINSGRVTTSTSMVDTNPEQPKHPVVDEEFRRRDVIYACCKQLPQQWPIVVLDENVEEAATANIGCNSDVHGYTKDEKKTSDDKEMFDEESYKRDGSIVSSVMLTETLVPALRELLRKIEQEREARENARSDDETDDEDDDIDELEYYERDSDLDREVMESRNTINHEEYMDAVLECFAGFVMNDWETKTIFVTCGAFEMSMHVLRQFLEEQKGINTEKSNQNCGRSEWKAAVSNDVEQIFNGMEIRILTTTSKIPPLVLATLANLTDNASEELKKGRVLPLLQLVHDCMTTFLSDPVVQGFGCWILHNLSNPLLQELVAAGSMSVVVSSMKCHPSDPLVQEHGNAVLYNLLPLILNCDSNQRMEIAPMMYREITALIPSLSAVVLRGMEQSATHLSVQQYGLLVLNRICQKNHDHYEVFISEGGLTVLLNNLKMPTTRTFEDNHGDGDMMEKRDCLAQLACQFVRDLSRPTNSSMDIVRIIAIKGGVSALVHLLEHYNAEAFFRESEDNNTNAINIVDPAMAALRNLFCHTENIRQVMADNYDNHRVIATVLRTMDCFPQDPPVQAYGCDCLGRLSQVEGARRELVDPVATTLSQSELLLEPSDAMLTVIRAMTNHRTHAGVQERAVVLLWVLIVHDNKHSSSLISRLREAHNELQQQRRRDMVMMDFLAFLEDTKVTPKGIERLEELVDAIHQYEQGKSPVVSRSATVHQKNDKENGRTDIRSLLVNSWTKLRQGEDTGLSRTTRG
jgi:DNA-binding protein H-NS